MGAKINNYLIFNGNCREAFEYYKNVFGEEFTEVSTFAEMPDQEGIPPVKDDEKDLIMHISLRIGKETILMGSDTSGEWAKSFKQGNNFSISVNTENENEANRIFRELSKEGSIMMPMDKTFWGSYFGMLTVKFGINWMISFAENPEN
ncbi:VOC family protein [Gramella lutea]|uniref:VOC family protein n=1 Tax=Christiangramia lutea TaxID=1607951 RepID=A0A9X2ABM2_9FLAO|nr:VOC family protein [Christiangramia lutea]MCH4824381.1 VOC family protein [Christiangramia lutea]